MTSGGERRGDFMHDAVVIGAGLAGAAAALRLADAGQSVALIEARGRLGGRAYSRAFEDAPDIVEFGGGWITDWHHRVKAQVARFGMDLRPRPPVSERRWHDGVQLRTDTPVAAAQMAGWTAAMQSIQADSLAMKGGSGRWEGGSAWADMSFADYMRAKRLPEAVCREFIAWWTICGSADISRVNVLDALHSAAHCGGTLDAMLEQLTHTIDGGAGHLVARMVAGSGADVILGDAVTAVADRGDHVAVRLSSGAVVKALQAVVAVPVNALATIHFDPALRPPQAQLATERHQGRAMKMMLRVQGVAPGTLVTGESEGLRLMFAERRLQDGSTLIIGFGLHDEVTDTSHVAMARAVGTFFPEGRLLSHDWHDWIRDPWSAGTWVSHGLGQSPLFEGAAWAAWGRLHFATSDIASRDSGWFEGAIIAGEEAADAILAARA